MMFEYLNVSDVSHHCSEDDCHDVLMFEHSNVSDVSHRCSDLGMVWLNRLGEERGAWVEACLVRKPFNLLITIVTMIKIQPFDNNHNFDKFDNNHNDDKKW